MRYASYTDAAGPHVGVVDGDSIIPLRDVDRIGGRWNTDTLKAAEQLTSQTLGLTAAQLLPASSQPGKILCVGLNYSDHIQETGRETPTYPVLFPKYASNLIAAREDIALPPESAAVDYEGELALVIGRAGRRIAYDDALDHILGFTVANDVTMRDFQYKTHQWLQGKAWDSSTPLGPYIVTPDEFDGTSARIRTMLNGVTVQDSDVKHLIFDARRLVELVSQFTLLSAGDVLLTGTPGGVGYRAKPQRLLTPGDRVRVEIDGLGAVENWVTAEQRPHHTPALHTR